MVDLLLLLLEAGLPDRGGRLAGAGWLALTGSLAVLDLTVGLDSLVRLMGWKCLGILHWGLGIAFCFGSCKRELVTFFLFFNGDETGGSLHRHIGRTKENLTKVVGDVAEHFPCVWVPLQNLLFRDVLSSKELVNCLAKVTPEEEDEAANDLLYVLVVEGGVGNQIKFHVKRVLMFYSHNQPTKSSVMAADECCVVKVGGDVGQSDVAEELAK